MKECTWFEQEYGWDTSCGEMFTLNDGTPLENDMKFCCFCGGKLSQELADPQEKA